MKDYKEPVAEFHSRYERMSGKTQDYGVYDPYDLPGQDNLHNVAHAAYDHNERNSAASKIQVQ